MKRFVILIAAALVAAPALADDKAVIWADASGGRGAAEPKEREIIWADSTGGLGAKQNKETDKDRAAVQKPDKDGYTATDDLWE